MGESKQNCQLVTCDLCALAKSVGLPIKRSAERNVPQAAQPVLLQRPLPIVRRLPSRPRRLQSPGKHCTITCFLDSFLRRTFSVAPFNRSRGSGDVAKVTSHRGRRPGPLAGLVVSGRPVSHRSAETADPSLWKELLSPAASDDTGNPERRFAAEPRERTLFRS